MYNSPLTSLYSVHTCTLCTGTFCTLHTLLNSVCKDTTNSNTEFKCYPFVVIYRFNGNKRSPLHAIFIFPDHQVKLSPEILLMIIPGLSSNPSFSPYSLIVWIFLFDISSLSLTLSLLLHPSLHSFCVCIFLLPCTMLLLFCSICLCTFFQESLSMIAAVSDLDEPSPTFMIEWKLIACLLSAHIYTFILDSCNHHAVFDSLSFHTHCYL